MKNIILILTLMSISVDVSAMLPPTKKVKHVKRKHGSKKIQQQSKANRMVSDENSDNAIDDDNTIHVRLDSEPDAVGGGVVSSEIVTNAPLRDRNKPILQISSPVSAASLADHNSSVLQVSSPVSKDFAADNPTLEENTASSRPLQSSPPAPIAGLRLVAADSFTVPPSPLPSSLPPPPPPPVMGSAGQPAPAAPVAGMSHVDLLKQGQFKLKPVDQQQERPAAPVGGETYLDLIKKGVKLRKVEPEQKPPAPVEYADPLINALNQIRVGVVPSSDSSDEEEEEEESW